MSGLVEYPCPLGGEPLPKRSATELAAALRTRADLISGQTWEAPATAEMMREAADLLELSVPLSAIRALVHQWREQAIRLHRDGNERDHVRESQSYCYGQEHAYQDCADQLAALCPAPPEDQT